MKRSFPPAREGLVGLAAVAIAGLGCYPDNSVKAGAPVLTQIVITQAGGAHTTITGDVPDCGTTIAGGETCTPPTGMPPVGDTMCRQVAAQNFCSCVTDTSDPPVSTWDCPQFSNVTAVIAVFDRLLDTKPLEPNGEVGIEDFAVVMAGAGAPAFGTITDYSSSGTPSGLITVLGGLFFGNYRLAGPSLLTAGAPAFPSGTAITIGLDPDKVRAKDGHTAFTGEGLLQDGMISFTTAPFSATVAGPEMPAPDATPATVSFTNFVDPETIVDHVHVTSNGAPFTAVMIASDGGSVTVTPNTAWPASATIVVSVDATAENILGQTIAAAASGMFMTAAM